MATQKEKLLQALKILQQKGTAVIHTDELTRSQREILLRNGFLRKVIKGQYFACDPRIKEVGEAFWLDSYWGFIANFLPFKYGNNWILSAEQSLTIHIGNWAVPEELIVSSPQANNCPTPLPHRTSIFNLKSNLPGESEIVVKRGLALYSLPSAVIYLSQAYYRNNSNDVRRALSMIVDASEILPVLLEKGHSKIGGRLAGAFRNVGQDEIADQILLMMKQAGYDIREHDPFECKL
jgi:hypothetical protein